MTAAERTNSSPFDRLDPPDSENLRSVEFDLAVKSGLYFLSCPALPGLHLTLMRDDQVRGAVDAACKQLLGDDKHSVTVMMNCKIEAPKVRALIYREAL